MIDAKGLYTAPAILPNLNLVKVTATIIADPRVASTAAVTIENPIPTVTSVTPTTVSMGSFTLTVKGRGLVRGAQVLFAGAPLQTNFNSSTQLLATGVATEAQLGRMQISVQNPDPGSTTSTASFNVQVNKPVIQASVSPQNMTLRAMDAQQFIVTIQGTSNSAASWVGKWCAWRRHNTGDHQSGRSLPSTRNAPHSEPCESDRHQCRGSFDLGDCTPSR